MNTCVRFVAGLSVLVLLSGCERRPSDQPEPAQSPEPGAGAVGTPPAWAARMRSALADPARPDEDRQQDADRKPDQVLAFLGIGDGMIVLDLFAAGGYHSEVLAAAVGPGGRVYAQNNEFLLSVRDGVHDKAMSARLAEGRLANLQRLDREVSELGLEAGSLDAVTYMLNYHDVYSFARDDRGTTRDVLRVLYELLKPGGILGIVDHAANPGPHDPGLHRINQNIVMEEVTSAGFVIEAESDLLRNPADDRGLSVFDQRIRGRTDRFLLRCRKPPATL